METLVITASQAMALSQIGSQWVLPKALSMRAANGMCQRLWRLGLLERRCTRPDGADILKWAANTGPLDFYEYRTLPTPSTL